MPTANDLIVLPFALLASLMATRVLANVNQGSWPTSLILIPLGALAWAAAAYEGVIDNFMRWLAPGWTLALLFTTGLGVALFGLLRRRQVQLAVAGWLGATAAGIATVSLTDNGRAHGGGLAACVGSVERFLPRSLQEMFLDILPNIALYLPVGFGLAALGWTMGRATLGAAAFACGVEIFQALATNRVCAPRDVWANALGAALGAGVLFALARLGGRGPQPAGLPEDELSDELTADT